MFYLFGSENSRDYDVIVIVDEISPTIDVNHAVCKEWNSFLEKEYSDKPLNCNLATIKDGYINDVFKGCFCEVNNALLYTYKLHDNQKHPLVLKGFLERNRHEKIKRVVRGILSFYSRSDDIAEIKNALRSDLSVRIPVVEKIDLSVYYDFRGKKEQYNDILKVLAFQFGQLFSLYDGYEPDSYTKNGIIKNYPNLSNLLNRGKIIEDDLIILNFYLKNFIGYIESNIDLLRINEKATN